jgi:hypothetical protein
MARKQQAHKSNNAAENYKYSAQKLPSATVAVKRRRPAFSAGTWVPSLYWLMIHTIYLQP